MFCIKCRKEIAEGTQYCTNCGQEVNVDRTALNQEAVLTTNKTKTDKGKGKILFAVLAVVAVVLAFRELYDYMSDQEYDTISEVARVTVGFTLDGDDKSVEVICIKMKNKWYYLNAN